MEGTILTKTQIEAASIVSLSLPMQPLQSHMFSPRTNCYKICKVKNRSLAELLTSIKLILLLESRLTMVAARLFRPNYQPLTEPIPTHTLTSMPHLAITKVFPTTELIEHGIIRSKFICFMSTC